MKRKLLVILMTLVALMPTVSGCRGFSDTDTVSAPAKDSGVSLPDRYQASENQRTDVSSEEGTVSDWGKQKKNISKPYNRPPMTHRFTFNWQSII